MIDYTPKPEVLTLWTVEESRINKEDIRVEVGVCNN